ncbi:tRNA lysidine(34) synthetase TilS [Synechococcus sp. RSCCF101]|uniref:tRNA lysidine(34) synthetase TilS n=1 Tax=Synechococcus sp. RSCCF101 TaxID=2511069 RepID=UPI0012459F48|nr:tRNA lysidine(34) synthetase TilS [Synechococcus sp. RSCCF101]QEY32529.1 tRNA lysidine(34) synthetase TilS [Synechococcus sp. RSCCF101]
MDGPSRERLRPSRAASATAGALRHLRQQLQRDPLLLPEQESLLLAVSGGQDSMALTQLLQDLQAARGWRLILWHGDHGWHRDSAVIAAQLSRWAERRGLELLVDRAPEGAARGEAGARDWRYAVLEQHAHARGCRRVITAHTASDRAESLLLAMARGCHLRGLCAPRRWRPLGRGGGCWLARPLLGLDRRQTAQLCRERALPVWPDPGNADLNPSRNRVRHLVMPVLEALHPGAGRRISGLSEAMARLQQPQEELIPLALRQLAGAAGVGGEAVALEREGLSRLSADTAALLLHHWLRSETGSAPGREVMEDLVHRLLRDGAAGKLCLPGPWELSWTRCHVHLHRQDGGGSSRDLTADSRDHQAPTLSPGD